MVKVHLRHYDIRKKEIFLTYKNVLTKCLNLTEFLSCQDKKSD